MIFLFIEKEVVNPVQRANFTSMDGVTRVSPDLRQIKPFV